jgi:dTDP-4-amino-4,6-dideoxygalactose transaminase
MQQQFRCTSTKAVVQFNQTQQEKHVETTITQRSVPFFNYPHVFVFQEQEFLSIIRDIGRRGAFILQKDLADFERHLAEYLGAKNAIGVANGTDALIIALRAAGIGPGDEVIFCSHTYVATAASIHFVGATPVPVECASDHLIDPTAVESAVTSRTKAVMPTQLNGRTCDMDALQAIADRHGLLIVEDAAQAMGSCYKGKAAGTFGIAGTISFYPAKTLGCFGDGGAIITNDDRVHERVTMLRDHGRNADGEVVTWGFNSRLDNLQAAILDHKLKRCDQEVGRRREIASIYQDCLGDLGQLLLPPAPGSDPDRFDAFQNYEIEAERRDELRAYLKERGIGTVVQWGGKAVHQFEGLGFDVRLPFTEEMFTCCMMLPMNTSLSNDDVEYVCDSLRRFYGN